MQEVFPLKDVAETDSYDHSEIGECLTACPLLRSFGNGSEEVGLITIYEDLNPSFYFYTCIRFQGVQRLVGSLKQGFAHRLVTVIPANDDALVRRGNGGLP